MRQKAVIRAIKSLGTEVISVLPEIPLPAYDDEGTLPLHAR